jgi:DNA (cytosine-5)-methyltransferase 1
MLTIRGLDRVLCDLASMGFDANWGVLGAADIGANHQRDRIWIVARWKGDLPHAQHDRIRWWEQQQKSIEEETRELANSRCQLWDEGNSRHLDTQEEIGTSSPILNQSGGQGCGEDQVAFPKIEGLERRTNSRNYESSKSRLRESGWTVERNWLIEPDVGRVANGVADRVDRLKAIGNGQVPLCAATAWRILSEQK